MALDAIISALQMVQCGEGLSQKSQSSSQTDTCMPIYVANQSITMAALHEHLAVDGTYLALFDEIDGK